MNRCAVQNRSYLSQFQPEKKLIRGHFVQIMSELILQFQVVLMVGNEFSLSEKCHGRLIVFSICIEMSKVIISLMFRYSIFIKSFISFVVTPVPLFGVSCNIQRWKV
jgi:hypothetical protein